MRGFIKNKIYIFIFGLLLIIGSVFVATDKSVTATEENTVPDNEENTVTEQASEDVLEENQVDQETTELTLTAEESLENQELEVDLLSSETENIQENISEEVVEIRQETVVEDKEIPVKKEEEYEATRTYNKKIFVNKDAKHTCEAEFFKVDLSDRDSATNTILLTKEADVQYEIEVGSLPEGYDMKFSNNSKYEKIIGLGDDSTDITIQKKSKASKGNFTIPIIYTQKGVFDSSVICQMNIVNL
jgi:hypothetical protein